MQTLMPLDSGAISEQYKQALPPSRIHALNFRMASTRLLHLRQSLFSPMWSWIWLGAVGFVSGLAWVRDEFGSPAIQQRLRAVSLLPHWNWETWALVWLSAATLVLFEGSFRVRRSIERERDKISEKLSSVGSSRALIYQSASIVKSEDNHLLGIRILFQNNGNTMLKYNFTKFNVNTSGQFDPALIPDVSDGYINTQEVLSYTVQLSQSFALNPPAQIAFEFEVEYDNIVPIQARTMGRSVTLHMYSLTQIENAINKWVEN